MRLLPDAPGMDRITRPTVPNRRHGTARCVLPLVTIFVSLAILVGAIPVLARSSAIAFDGASLRPVTSSELPAVPTATPTAPPAAVPTAPLAATPKPAALVFAATPSATPKPTPSAMPKPTPSAMPKPTPTPKPTPGATPKPTPTSTPTPKARVAPRPTLAPTPAAPTYAGTNHVWIPSLGVNRPVLSFPCSRSQEPDNYVYVWGCAGANNVYLLGHAYGVFQPLYDAYYSKQLMMGMTVVYADGSGAVHTYAVTWWKVVLPTTDASWAWAALPAPGMTLQTCVGANSEYRLMVRLDQVS